MNTETASSITYERERIGVAYEKLSRFPSEQAEAIARHYVAHAQISMQIIALVEARRHSASQDSFDAAIDYCVQQIKQNHKYDLNIELKWPRI